MNENLYIATKYTMPIITRIRTILKLDKKPAALSTQLVNEWGLCQPSLKYFLPPSAEISSGIAGGGCLINNNKEVAPAHHMHADPMPVMHHAGH